MQLLTAVYGNNSVVPLESYVNRIYSMLKPRSATVDVATSRLFHLEKQVFWVKPPLDQKEAFWNFVSSCIKEADARAANDKNNNTGKITLNNKNRNTANNARKNVIVDDDDDDSDELSYDDLESDASDGEIVSLSSSSQVNIQDLNSIIQNLKKLENEMLEKDKRLEQVMTQCSIERAEIASNLKNLQQQLQQSVNSLSVMSSVPSPSPLSTKSSTAAKKAPRKQAEEQGKKAKAVPVKAEAQTSAPTTASSSVMLVSKREEETPEARVVDQKKVDEVIKMINVCLLEAKFADAARLALSIPVGQISNETLFSIFKALEAPELLPPSATDNIVQLIFSALKHKRGAQKDEVIDRVRVLVNYFARRMTIRRFEYIVSLLNRLYAECPLSFRQLMPVVAQKAPKLQKLRQLLKFQTYIAAMLVGNPKDSRNILTLYKPAFDQLVKEEQAMTFALHETSLEAIRQYDLSLNLRVEEDQPDKVEQAIASSVASSKPLQTTVHPVESQERVQIEHTISEFSTSALTEEANQIFERLAPTSEETHLKTELVEELSDLCKYVIPTSEVYAYGSSASNLGIKGSDIDLCIKLDQDISADNHLQMSLLNLIYKAMKADEFEHLTPAEQPVTRSRVPILQVKDNKRGFECDICIGNLLGVTNTKMLKLYSEIDPRVRPLIYVVKHWAKLRHINDPPSGSLSSYSYVILVINYLQSIKNPILPSLQALLTHPEIEPSDISEPHFVNAYDCRYVCNLEKVQKIWTENKKNTSTLGQLVLGFFTYYNTSFDFNHKTASIRLGQATDKKSNIVISIEDPFEKRDLGGVVSDTMVPKIVEEFKRAYNILNNGGSIADIVEERKTETDEVNIYNIKQDYEDHMTIGEAERLIASGELKKGVLRVNKLKFKEAYVTVPGFKKDVFVDGFKARNRALHGDLVAVKISYERKVKVDFGNQAEKGHSSNSIEPVSEEYTVTGSVVCILSKKSPTYFPCTVMKQDDEQNKGFRWLLPMDKAYPKIMVQFEEFRQAFNARAVDLEEVIIIGEMNLPWAKGRHYPKGKVVGVLGLKRDLWSQKRAILLQHMPSLFENVLSTSKENRDKERKAVSYVEGANVSNETKKAENLLKKRESWDINNIEIDIEKEIADGYVDWRKRRVFTIDPPSSRDLDDALSIDHAEGEWYNVTVYVADVTRFVKEGDETDLEARKRATSVYLLDTVDHMLDPSLSQNLCSILPGVTRFSVAVEFWMNTKGEIRYDTVNFTRCIIRSCCRMDYDSVQEVLMGRQIPEDKRKMFDGFEWKDIEQDLKILNEMTQSLRKARYENGSVELSNQELQFELDEDGYPVKVTKAVHNESHQLIEEYALLANKLAATVLNDYYQDNCLLRQHSPPSAEGWSETVTQMADAISNIHRIVHVDEPSKGSVVIEIAAMLKANAAPQEVMNKLQSYTEKYPYMQQAVRHALLREMQLAKYCRKGDCDETFGSHHFALNMELYTHFTSPIRRYADIIVHRQLLQMIEEKKRGSTGIRPVPSIYDGELTKIVENINEQAYQAKSAEDISQRQYLAYYLMPIVSERVERVEALVMSLGKRAFTVYVPKYCIEIKCNIMKQFVPAPQSITESEHNADGTSRQIEENESDKEGLVIDALTITWSNQNSISESASAEERMRHLALNRSLELRPLKRILVDLDINYDAVPLDVFAYNVWEFEEQIEAHSGRTLASRNRLAVSSDTDILNTPQISESYIRDQKEIQQRERRDRRENQRKKQFEKGKKGGFFNRKANNNQK